MLLDCLPEPHRHTAAAGSLLAGVPEPESEVASGGDLLAAIPDPELPELAPNLEISP